MDHPEWRLEFRLVYILLQWLPLFFIPAPRPHKKIVPRRCEIYKKGTMAGPVKRAALRRALPYRDPMQEVSYTEGTDPAELQAEMELQRRMEGISTVGGSTINIQRLLMGFYPSNDIARDMKEIEMVAPMIRPYGCGPVAPQDWVVLRTYAKIIELREGVRMDTSGIVLCDRDCKRFYQEAIRQMISTNTVMGRVNAIEIAFRSMLDKLWHRYMFPFGTFLYVTPPSSAGKTESTFKESLQTGKDSKCMINAHSVALADVLYLCNTAGYLERFVYIAPGGACQCPARPASASSSGRNGTASTFCIIGGTTARMCVVCPGWINSTPSRNTSTSSGPSSCIWR